VGYIRRDLAEFILEEHWQCDRAIDHLYADLSNSGTFYDLHSPIIGVQEGLASDINA
jgi:hypothetical protein